MPLDRGGRLLLMNDPFLFIYFVFELEIKLQFYNSLARQLRHISIDDWLLLCEFTCYVKRPTSFKDLQHTFRCPKNQIGITRKYKSKLVILHFWIIPFGSWMRHGTLLDLRHPCFQKSMKFVGPTLIIIVPFRRFPLIKFKS